MPYRSWYKKITQLFLIISTFSFSCSTFSADKPFDPIGQWRTFHKDGSSFVLTLHSDGTALSTADNQEGVWRWEKDAVYIDFTDGWRDVIEKGNNGSFVKKSWGPDANREKPSQNISKIEKIILEKPSP